MTPSCWRGWLLRWSLPLSRIFRTRSSTDRLPESERDTAARVLEGLAARASASAVPDRSFFSGSSTLAAINPNAKPINDLSELAGTFWPEEEGPDDFVNALREWRRQG
jgi:hypothetical protein